MGISNAHGRFGTLERLDFGIASGMPAAMVGDEAELTIDRDAARRDLTGDEAFCEPETPGGRELEAALSSALRDRVAAPPSVSFRQLPESGACTRPSLPVPFQPASRSRLPVRNS